MLEAHGILWKPFCRVVLSFWLFVRFVGGGVVVFGVRLFGAVFVVCLLLFVFVAFFVRPRSALFSAFLFCFWFSCLSGGLVPGSPPSSPPPPPRLPSCRGFS